jgi:hypothetical protein
MGEGSISALSVAGDTKSFVAAAIWDYIRDEVLQAHDWNFAKAEVELAKDSTYTSLDKWDYRYTKPSSCLRIRKVRDEYNNYVPYEEMGDYIYTDWDNSNSNHLYIDYTAIITDPTKYTASFVSALSCRLAAEFSMKLSPGNQKLQDRMMGYYEASLSNAIGVNQSRGYVEEEAGHDEWIRAGR